MKLLILIIIIGTIIYFFAKVSKKKNGKSNTAPKTSRRKARDQNKSKLESNLEWLDNRWKLAEEQKQAGLTGIFPQWYFDEVTERQVNKLDELGISVKKKKLTKGNASDLIGMHEPADEESLEILKYFKVSTKDINQTKARHEIALIFDNKLKAEAWKNRPPSQIQKEFFMFFGIKPEKGMTNSEASIRISKYESVLTEENDPKLDEWEAFEEIIDELSDSDFREDYEIKKPNISLIRNALVALQKEGKSYRDVADDIDLVVNKMVELKPDLRRE